MTRRADDARLVRDMLQDRLRELLGRLLPGGRFDGGTYVVKNPTRPDRNAGSFIVWTSGSAKGGFKDYATDDKGDVIDLIAYVHGRPKDKRFAFDWARDFLGLKHMDPKVRQAAEDAARAKARQAEAAEKADAVQKRRRAMEMFLASKPIAGSLAETYLAARGVPLSQVPNLESDLRFASRLEWWRGAEWREDHGRRVKVRPGPEFPAMVAAVRNLQGDILAVHCTFLRFDGSGKADVENAKLMYGSVAGCVVRLTRGPANLSLDEAALSGRSDILVIAEGIETGLSVAIAAPEARVWAATSLSNIGNAPVWHAAVRAVLIAADNVAPDASAAARAQAEEQLERARDKLAVHGVPVDIMRPHAGGDFNDLIRGAV